MVIDIITYISNERCIGVWRPDVIMFVEIPVGRHVQLVGGVQVCIAAIASATTFVKTWENARERKEKKYENFHVMNFFSAMIMNKQTSKQI